MTAICGLVGHPVAHSISPQFQQAAFVALGIDARYLRWDTPPDRLAERLAELRSAEVLGANVTVPHKEAVMPQLDELTELARQAGAVNTIVREGSRLRGENTDVAGFARALSESAGFDVAGRKTVVLGAGGAARAVVLALCLQGAAEVLVANRDVARAERLVAALQAVSHTSLSVLAWADAVNRRILASIDLLVNCTSLGMAGSAGEGKSPLPAAALTDTTFVCDIVANPRRTPLLRAAEATGCQSLGGLSMLVFQGAASFEAWTGRAAPIAVMLAAAEEAMGRVESSS